MLAKILYETAERNPEHPAIVYGETRLSYGALVEKTERLAQGLVALGIGPGDRVALVHPNTPEFVITFLAVTALGAVVVPLNPGYTAEELAFYFEHCQVRAAVTDAQRAPTCERLLRNASRSTAVVVTGPAPAGALGFDHLIESHAARRVLGGSPEAEAVYQFTSGSTGRPKRVPRTHAQLGWEAENMVATTGLGRDDRIFCLVPLFHTHGQGNCMLAAIRSGATLVMMENPNPFPVQRVRALHLLETEHVTVFPGVPFLFHMLAAIPDAADLSSLRLCFSAGTSLPRETFESFRRRFGVSIRQLYGCTEAGALSINLDGDPDVTSASVGRPLEGVRIQIVDEAKQPVPEGECGEVAVSTSAMTRGYHNLDEHNREVFRDGFFYTGDLGRLDAEGRLWITGRKKLFIQVVGNKVDPIEVEDVLGAHPAVREAVVVGIPGNAPGEEIVKAVVVAGASVSRSELVRHCFDRLSPFKVPEVFEFRDEIPKNPLGKVLRKYLV